MNSCRQRPGQGRVVEREEGCKKKQGEKVGNSTKEENWMNRDNGREKKAWMKKLNE